MSYEICDGKEVIAVDQVSNEQAIAWHDECSLIAAGVGVRCPM